VPNFISFATSIAELAHGEKLRTYSSSLSAAREQKRLRIRNISDVNLDAVGVEVSSIIADDDGRFAAELSAVFTAHLYRYNMLYYLSTMRTCNHALSPSKYQTQRTHCHHRKSAEFLSTLVTATLSEIRRRFLTLSVFVRSSYKSTVCHLCQRGQVHYKSMAIMSI